MYNVIGRLESDVTLLKENIGEYVSVIKSGATPVEVENKEILKAFTSDQVNDATMYTIVMGNLLCAYNASRITDNNH